MKDIGIEVNGARKASQNERMKPSRGLNVPVGRSQPKELAGATESDTDTESDADTQLEESIKARFQTALKANYAAEESLSAVVADAIAADFDRDDCIAWGLEAGLSDSYVRSTVSRLFIELTGVRVKAKGNKRKVTKGAEALAKRVLKETENDYGKAKAMLLAARRLLEKWEKEESKQAK